MSSAPCDCAGDKASLCRGNGYKRRYLWPLHRRRTEGEQTGAVAHAGRRALQGDIGGAGICCRGDAVEVVVGDFAHTLDDTLRRAGQVDLAFIDGFHDGKATIGYHAAFKEAAAPGAVLIYDDINWSDGMTRAWDAIRQDGEVQYVLDYGAMGVVGLS